MSELPKLDRDEYRRRMRAAFEKAMDEVCDAVDDAPSGRVITDSEEKARDALDEFRRAAYEEAIQMKTDAAEAAFPPPTCPITNRRKRNKGRQRKTWLTINGLLVFKRTRWHCREDGSETPMDALLDEAEATVSRGVIEIACRLNQGSTSFQHTADMLFRAAHIPSNKETLRQLIEAEGRAVLSAMQQSQLTPDWAAEDCSDEGGVTRLYIGCDGVSIPLVTDEEKRKRRQNTLQKRKRRGRKCKPLPRRKTGADNAYKEFKVARIYDQTMAHCLVGVTSGNCEAAGRMMRRMELQVAMSEADQRIALFDGAPWIRNQIEFHSLADHSCLDFYHLQDYAQKTRRSVFGEEGATGKQWLGELMHAFKHDGYSVGMERLWETRKSLRGGKRSSLDSLIQYAAERRDIICYPQFRDQGWQIGSGPTESSCKTTTHRVKGRGRRWDSRNAEAMMALSALHDSKLWNKHWLTQETVSI